MEEQLNSLKKTARIAGLWYLLLVIAGIYGIKYVDSQIFVDGNTVATTNNVLAHEFLFRTGIFSAIIGNFIFLFLVLALYRLLKQVNERQAKLMVILVILQIPVSFLIELFNLTSLMILNSDVLKTLEPAKRQDFAALFLAIHGYGINILEVFWGIWLIPLGQLVYKSGFIPRIIGILLIIGGIAYMVSSFMFLLFPAYFSFVSNFIIASSLGEIAIMLWLLIAGVKVKKMG
jgi:hypothetical protein